MRGPGITARAQSRSALEETVSTYCLNWRMGWDSNPRWALTHGGFQDRCLKPLGHPSSPPTGRARRAKAHPNPSSRALGASGFFCHLVRIEARRRRGARGDCHDRRNHGNGSRGSSVVRAIVDSDAAVNTASTRTNHHLLMCRAAFGAPVRARRRHAEPSMSEMPPIPSVTASSPLPPGRRAIGSAAAGLAEPAE